MNESEKIRVDQVSKKVCPPVVLVPSLTPMIPCGTNLYYYRLTYHYRYFHCHSDRSDGVILAPSVGTIARPPRTKTGSLDFYHRQVNDRCGSAIGVAFPLSHEKPG